MKVVVDTNIFVSAVMNPEAAPRQVIRLCLQGAIIPLMGNSLFAEYEDVCSRGSLFEARHIPSGHVDTLLNAFLSQCQWTPIYYLWRPNLRDEADNHLIELAVAGGAEYIITANLRDFLQPSLLFPGIKIRTAGDFLNQWRS